MFNGVRKMISRAKKHFYDAGSAENRWQIGPFSGSVDKGGYNFERIMNRFGCLISDFFISCAVEVKCEQLRYIQ